MKLLARPVIASRRQAIEKFEAAIPLWHSGGAMREEADTMHALAFAYSSLGDRSKALDHYLREVPLRHAIGDRRGEGGVLNDIGTLTARLAKLGKHSTTSVGHCR